MHAKLPEVAKILTDRFCIQPFVGALPKGVPYIGMRFKCDQELPDEHLWLNTLEPIWGSLSMNLADKRCGVSMFQPFWTLAERDDGSLDVTICTEPDPTRVAEAMIEDAGHRIGRA